MCMFVCVYIYVYKQVHLWDVNIAINVTAAGKHYCGKWSLYTFICMHACICICVFSASEMSHLMGSRRF